MPLEVGAAMVEGKELWSENEEREQMRAILYYPGRAGSCKSVTPCWTNHSDCVRNCLHQRVAMDDE